MNSEVNSNVEPSHNGSDILTIENDADNTPSVQQQPDETDLSGKDFDLDNDNDYDYDYSCNDDENDDDYTLDYAESLESNFFSSRPTKTFADNFQRASKSHKHPKVNPSRFISAREYKKQEETAEWMEYVYDSRSTSATSSGSNPASVTRSTPSAMQTREERELQKVITASRTQKHASGLTLAQLAELTSRELTPEDYELLLMLDTQVQAKTTQKSAIDMLKETKLEPKDVASCQDCAVCMCPLEAGQLVKHLPCKHFFHSACIVPWLQGHSQNCPLCNAKVL